MAIEISDVIQQGYERTSAHPATRARAGANSESNPCPFPSGIRSRG